MTEDLLTKHRETITQELRETLRASGREELMEAVKQSLMYWDEEVERYIQSPIGQAHINNLVREFHDFELGLDMPPAIKN